MKDRRSKSELWRDILLVLYTSPDRTEKPTRLMYGANLSWRMLRGETGEGGLLHELVERQLVDKIDLNPDRRKRDYRTNVLFKLTRKGEIVLRFIDALELYIRGTEPQITIPLPLLRNMFRSRFGGVDVLDNMFSSLAEVGMSQNTRELVQARRQLVHNPTHPTNMVRAEKEIMELLPEELPVMVDDMGREGPKDARLQVPEDGSQELVAGFTVRTFEYKDYDGGWYQCPHCASMRRTMEKLVEHVKEKHGDSVEQ